MAHTVGMAISVILHNIRSAHNVGSIFRTADGAGVSSIYLSGYTPAPLDRFGRENTEIAKTSLGATHTIRHESVPDIQVLIQKLKVAGATVVAVEQGKDAVDYRKYSPDADTVFIFGNEITGVEPEVLAGVDACVHIPMSGMKESLNVSVCAGIILFHYR